MPPKKIPQFTEEHIEKIDKMKEFMTLHTAFSASVGQKLEDMTRVLKEVHDKLDQSLLINTEKFAKLEGRDILYEEKLNTIKIDQEKRVTNWWNSANLLVTIFITMIGAIIGALSTILIGK